MSVIENLRHPTAKPAPGARGAIPKAPDVAAQLSQAENDLAALDAQHGTAALDAIARSPGASDRLTALNGKLTEARERISTLRAAHRAAVERDEALIQAQRAALQKTQLNAIRKHLELRSSAAEALSTALAEAAKQYHLLLDHSAKAMNACPVGMSWPGGSDCGPDVIRRLVACEVFRLSASLGFQSGLQDIRALPGPELPSMEFQWQPTATPAMTDRIKKANAAVITTLTGKVPG